MLITKWIYVENTNKELLFLTKVIFMLDLIEEN